MKIAVVIPAFNEERVIGSVLKQLPRKLPGIETIDMIVVNDGSTDATENIAKTFDVVVLRHVINRGLGATLGTGLAYARDHGYDLVVTFDADGQHDPAELKDVIQPVLQGRAEVVVGTRLKKPDGMPWHRRIGIWAFNLITFVLFGVWTTDSQSGLRVFSRRALEQMEIDFQGMEVSSGLFSEIGRLKLRYVEVPIQAIYTDYSLAKGQRPGNGFSILFRLLWHKFVK